MSLFKKSFGTGALLDTRTPSEKEKDYRFEEAVAMANPVPWFEKPKSSWRKFPVITQGKSGSCVAQTMAKLLGIMYWLLNNVFVEFSGTHIYKRRVNRPQPGMAGVDAFEIARRGVTLEVLAPSKDLTDEQMDATKIEKYKEDVGAIFQVPNYLSCPTNNIDTIASIIDTTGKGVMVWFFFKDSEWAKFQPVVKYPALQAYDQEALRHSVTAVDFTIYNGKKCLVIEDSAPFGGLTQRVIDEDFFAARNFFAAYPMNFKFNEVVSDKPKYHFGYDLKFSPAVSYSVDVVALQDILKYEGLFPVNMQSTGYYGAITASAVLKWQIAHEVAPISELNSLGGKVVGQKTRAKLNELYA